MQTNEAIRYRGKHNITRALLLLSMALIITISSYAHNEFSGQKILVIINGDTVTTADVDGLLMKYHASIVQERNKDYDLRKLLDKLINDRLIQQEAGYLGMDEEPWLLDILNNNKIGLARTLFIRETFTPDLTISNQEISAFFTKYYYKMQLRTISIRSLEMANEFKKLINNGADMDSLAKAESFDSKKYKGGLHKLKYFADIEKSFREEALKLEIGNLSPPIPFKDVFVILRLEQKIPVDMNELPYFKNKLKRNLRAIKQEEMWTSYLDSLKSSVAFNINEKQLDIIKNDGSNLFTAEFLKGNDSVVIEIGPENFVTNNKIRKEISYAAMSNGTAPYDSLVENTIKGLKAELILNYSAQKGGYLDDPMIAGRFQKSLDSALIQVYLSEIIGSRIFFNRQEFEEYYNDNPEQFRNDEKYQIAQIQISSRDSAVIFMSRLKDGGKFDFIQNKFDPENKSNSNSRDWITLNSFPAKIRQNLKNLKIGQSSDILKTNEGFIILSIKNRKKGEIRSINEVDMQIRDIMYQKKFNQYLDENLKLIKEHSEIVYFEDNINNYFLK